MKTFLRTFFCALSIFGLMAVGTVSTLSSTTVGCTWTISKTASYGGVPVTQLTLAPGQQFIVNFTITVDIAPGSVCTPYPTDWVDVYDPYLATPENPDGHIRMVKYGVTPLPWVFGYSRIIGPYDCGDYVIENTASLFQPPSTEASSTWTILVHVPCPEGCTLTPGYWKTHSKYGPAPWDDTWANGEDAIFFLSNKTWYEILWTAPKKGDAYYILAHAYIAAKLNMLNGTSSTPGVDAAIAWAENSFFNLYAPASVPRGIRNQAISYANILDQYNNGYIGPGHCSE